MDWSEASWDSDTLTLFRAALSLRRARPALRRGDEIFLPATTVSGEALDEVLVFRRALADEIIDVLLHAGEGEREIALPSGAASSAELLLQVGDATLDLDKGTLRLGPSPPPCSPASHRRPRQPCSARSPPMAASSPASPSAKGWWSHPRCRSTST